MNRPISEDDLHGYVDNALLPSRQAEVEQYLKENPELASRYEGFARQRAILAEALDPIAREPVPPHLNLANLMAAHRRPRWFAWQAAAAAAFLFLAGGSAGWLLRGVGAEERHGITALANEATYAYMVFGPDQQRPVEIVSKDKAAFASWLEARLAHPVSFPDLSGEGYRFIGGRIVATQNGPAGLLMYADAKGARIAILMRPMAIDQNAPMAEHRATGVVGYAWADDGMGYSLVGGPENAVRLHPIADEARRQLRSRA